jgi:phage gp36-like protein
LAQPYHELADLEASGVSEAQLVQLTNDDDDATTVDATRYEACRAEADAEVDGYIGARYALPLATNPIIIKRLSTDITVFRLFRRRFQSGVPPQVQSDYERACKLLADIAKGTVTLGVQPAAAANSERTAQIVAGARTFSRDSLKDF